MKWPEVGFSSLWSPSVILFIVLLGAAYFMIVGPWRGFFKEAAPVGIGKKVTFTTALLLYYIAQGSPVNYLGHHDMFSVHMIQQSIAYLMVPPLVYLGLPSWLMKTVLDSRWIRPWIRQATNPILSVVLFNMLFSMYHIPLVFNWVYDVAWMHNGYHYLLLISAFHMWFPVFCNVPEYDRLSSLQKLAYIFANGVLLTPACALIIFADTLLYPHYSEVPQQYTLMPVLQDQQLGGVIMKIAQEIIYGTVLAYIFFRWYHTEKRKEEDDDLVDGEYVSYQGSGRLNGA